MASSSLRPDGIALTSRLHSHQHSHQPADRQQQPPRSPWQRQRRTVLGGFGSIVALLPAAPSLALMAGLSPDSPERRVLGIDALSPWSGVGAVLVDRSVYSGVLIGPGHVLTAAHVVAGHAASRIRFRPAGAVAATDEQACEISHFVLHPDYRGFTSPLPFADLAVLTLAGAPPRVSRRHVPSPRSVRIGDVLTFVGFGASGRGDVGPSVPARADIARIGGNLVERLVARDEAPAIAAAFYYDFDPPAPDSETYELGTPGKGSLGNGFETIAATGDSGAPVFFVSPAGPELVGLLTFVTEARSLDRLPPGVSPGRTSVFGTRAGGMLLRPNLDWLRQQTGN